MSKKIKEMSKENKKKTRKIKETSKKNKRNEQGKQKKRKKKEMSKKDKRNECSDSSYDLPRRRAIAKGKGTMSIAIRKKGQGKKDGKAR